MRTILLTPAPPVVGVEPADVDPDEKSQVREQKARVEIHSRCAAIVFGEIDDHQREIPLDRGHAARELFDSRGESNPAGFRFLLAHRLISSAPRSTALCAKAEGG